MGNAYNWVYIWCCKYGENRYSERCTNKKWCASKHTGLLNSCLGKLCLLPYLAVPLISARFTLISTRVSAHCHAILFPDLEKFYFSLTFPWRLWTLQEIPQPLTTKISLKITHLKFTLNLPGANELIWTLWNTIPNPPSVFHNHICALSNYKIWNFNE